ncbi:MAG: N-acetyl-gamma-glutamyl-phosphate reductase [Acidobacteria bacterium]|nr:N-acetyl-gamma-glutamyl-phosphate reductase [Acidobacteriota bacterium]
MRAVVIGASGYAGSELLRISAAHPELDVVVATGDSAAGRYVRDHTPALRYSYPDLQFTSVSDAKDVDCDVAFVALPHGASQSVVPHFLERDVMVVDLGADYRLTSANDYQEWYGESHRTPDLLGSATYGLVERHRDDLRGSRFIAVPGCYPTATSLALGPFIDRNVIDGPYVVNALSGVSGAGRTPSERLHFPRLEGNAEAYGLLRHRHTIEMQQELGVELLFTPHLVPVSRGMLVTAYAQTTTSLSTDESLDILRSAYTDNPCVVVVEEPPTLKDPLGSNLCFVSARVDQRTGWLIAMSSIDNLVKGASGQAVQAWNVAMGLPETLGLPMSGITP